MAEFISCRNCDSAYCEGCNIYTLATMLQAGKFDCLMDENHSVNPAADVTPVVHGEWEDYHFVKVDCPKSGFPTVKCSKCEIVFCDLINNHHFMYHFCPNCGADMRERKGDD